MSLEICATGMVGVQLSHGPGGNGSGSELIQSEESGLMTDELIGGEVEDCGVGVGGLVFEQEVIAALDQAKVEVVGCLDHIANCLDQSLMVSVCLKGKRVSTPSSPIKCPYPCRERGSCCRRRF